MREQRDVIERERAVAGLHRFAVVARERVRERRRAGRPRRRAELRGDLRLRELRVLDAMHLFFWVFRREHRSPSVIARRYRSERARGNRRGGWEHDPSFYFACEGGRAAGSCSDWRRARARPMWLRMW